MATTATKVFVYGTLRRGQPNHYLIADRLTPTKTSDGKPNEEKSKNAEARYLGQVVTTERWPLVIAGRYNIPLVLDCRGTGEFVKGDAFEVNPECLSVLDDLEEHPDFYERTPIQGRVVTSPDGAVISEETQEEDTFHIYLMKNFKKELLGRRFYSDYGDSGDDTEAYVHPPALEEEWHYDVKVTPDQDIMLSYIEENITIKY